MGSPCFVSLCRNSGEVGRSQRMELVRVSWLAHRQEAVGCRFPVLGGFGLHCAWFSEERAVDSALRLRAFCQ